MPMAREVLHSQTYKKHMSLLIRLEVARIMVSSSREEETIALASSKNFKYSERRTKQK